MAPGHSARRRLLRARAVPDADPAFADEILETARTDLHNRLHASPARVAEEMRGSRAGYWDRA
jgi:hypothetical protein